MHAYARTRKCTTTCFYIRKPKPPLPLHFLFFISTAQTSRVHVIQKYIARKIVRIFMTYKCTYILTHTNTFIYPSCTHIHTHTWTCGPGRQLWPDMRVGVTAYLLQGPAIMEKKPQRIERIDLRNSVSLVLQTQPINRHKVPTYTHKARPRMSTASHDKKTTAFISHRCLHAL